MLRQVAVLPKGKGIFTMPMYAFCKIKIVLIDNGF